LAEAADVAEFEADVMSLLAKTVVANAIKITVKILNFTLLIRLICFYFRGPIRPLR
jgi:hypothetical protein